MFEEIKLEGVVLAIIIRRNYQNDGIKFFTPNEFSQQLAYMKRPKDYVIAPHVHNEVARTVSFTKEVLLIRSGRVRVDFYSEKREYLESRELLQGDVVLLAFGGHGFEMMEDSEIIEIKQGPYAGEEDKVRFEPAPKSEIKIIF